MAKLLHGLFGTYRSKPWHGMAWHSQLCLKTRKPKKSGKKKEVTCFRCKKVGHYLSQCNEELPTKPAKSGYKMIIMNKDNSVHLNQENEEPNDEKFQDQEEEPTEDTGQEVGNDSDDEETDTNTEEETEDNMGTFEDKDYEGIIFAQKDILYNLQEKVGIPSSRILLDSQSTVDVFFNSKMLTNISRKNPQSTTLQCRDNIGYSER